MQQDQEKQAGNEQDNPALSSVIARNIRTIIHLRGNVAHERVLQMLDAIQDKLGIIDHEDSELTDLEMGAGRCIGENPSSQAIELSNG